MSSISVFEAGGGKGRTNIRFDTLNDGQASMFARTVHYLSDFERTFREQEKRQITIIDTPVTLKINLAREDFPEINAEIEIVYIPSAASQAWEKFLRDACKLLKIDFIHSILDRTDKSPISRVLRLRPGGEYLARQRETSSILEVINTGRTPMEVSWPITMDINDVKQSLAFSDRSMPEVETRIAELVSKPATLSIQREVASMIANAATPGAVVNIIEQFHNSYANHGASGHPDVELGNDPMSASRKRNTPNVSFKDIEKYKKIVDIVTLHRLCLESLARFAARGFAKDVAGGKAFTYTQRVIDELRVEVDVVVIGLKLLSDVMKYLVDKREETFTIVLDCVQAYAPPAPWHKPRNPKRLLPSSTEAMVNMVGFSSAGGGEVPVNRAQNKDNEIHPSLTRYGDFYGQSTASGSASAAKLMSETINIKNHKYGNMDILSRFNKELYNIHMDDDHEKRDGDGDGVSDVTGNVDIGDQLNDTPTDPRSNAVALVRGRGRINHVAASHALQTAFQQQQQQENSVEGGGGTAACVKNNSDGGKKVRSMQASGERKPNFIFKLKPKMGNDVSDVKKGWKGTVGELGRPAPKKEEEVVIDFKKKVVYDPSKDNRNENEELKAPVLNVDESNTGGNLQEVPKVSLRKDGKNDGLTSDSCEVPVPLAGETSHSQPNAANASDSIDRHRRRKNRGKGHGGVIPLPQVPCIVFRGLSGKTKRNMAVQQAFATLYRAVAQNYGNRDVAFNMGVVEEISEVIAVCQEMPRVLEYYIWTIDSLFRDGFGEVDPAELDMFGEDPTMVLSSHPDESATFEESNAENPRGTTRTEPGTSLDITKVREGEEGPMTGHVYETMSEMSIPTIDKDGLMSEPTIEKSDLLAIPAGNDDQLEGQGPSVAVSVASRKHGANNGVSDIGTEDARDPHGRDPSNPTRKAANQLLINALGLHDFEARYVKRPAECVILGVALISTHAELEPREKQMANRWLDTWDDCSREYKLLKKRGKDLSGL